MPVPDQKLTPGVVLTTDKTKVCRPGYSASVRKVSGATKTAAYAEYGVKTHKSYQYEVDHLLPLELGGSNDLANLWPEPADRPYGANSKDLLENEMHKQVCAGKVTLADAQQQILTSWVDAWPKYMPTPLGAFFPATRL